MERTVKIAFSPGDIVSLRTDPDMRERMVVRVSIHEGGADYGLRIGDRDITYHGPMEISDHPERKKPVAGFRKTTPEPKWPSTPSTW